MKKSIAIMSAVIGVLAGATTSAIVISEKRRKFKKACDDSLAKAINDSCEAVKKMPHYDFSDIEIIDGSDEKAIDVPIPEESQFGTDNRGRMITPEAIVMELPEAGRKVELGTDGVIRCFEDDEIVTMRMLEHWPVGNYKIHYYRSLGMASRFAYLFFEETKADSFFCKAQFKKSGYYPMAHVLVLGEDLSLVPISFPKDSEGSNDFHVGNSNTPDCFGGKKVMLRVPDHTHCGDTQRTIRDFAYVGEDDEKFYLCDIENIRVVRRNPVNVDKWRAYELIGWNMVADCGDCYMVCNFGDISRNFPAKYFEDSFGKHSFERFKAACGQCLDDSTLFIRPAFYREIPAPKEGKKCSENS